MSVSVSRVFTMAAAAAVLLLAGCGSDVPSTGGDDPTVEVTPTDGTGSAEPPTGAPTDPGQPTDGPTDAPTGEPTGPGSTPQPTPSGTDAPTSPTELPTQLTGFPEAGVEAGCWLLDGYLLLGGDETLLASGREVQVTGAVEEGVMTTCQQGIPFRVDSTVGIEP